MSIQTIDGACYARMLSGGAACLCAHAAELNDLNVFPVCDGDTGTNMQCTLEGGLAQLSQMRSIGAVTDRFAKGALLAARGNSGVILSQIFAGINEALRDVDCADAHTLAHAYESGIKKSYAAVQNPTEGTILTVFRESTRFALENMGADATVEDFFRLHTEEARRSLARTPELLPVLAQADVVDSGGAGYLYIAQGMYEALTGKEIAPVVPQQAAAAPDIDSFTRDSRLEFGYCTEFLLRLTTAKCDPDTFDIQTILTQLENMGGESIVAYKQDDVVKVHVHTFTPGEILTMAQRYGEFLTLKVENMSVGHSETPRKKAPKKPYSIVAVATGAGMEQLFTRLGADALVSGGQTANPSTQDFLEAFKTCEAEHILVLPNNGNIYLAAQQAAQLYTDATVHVLKTGTMMAGYSALSVITPGITDIDALVESAQRAADAVCGFEITKAVRDACVDGQSICQGQYMALQGKTLAALADTPEDAVLAALENEDADLCEIITVFVGKDAAASAELSARLEEAYPDCEITMHDGGQGVYEYLVAME